MTLSDVFFVLQQSGCRLRVSAEGDIMLDAPAGCPPVPLAVLEVLAKHRETLVAVLAPAKPSEPAAGPPLGSTSAAPPGRRSPYARANLAVIGSPEQTRTDAKRPPLDVRAIREAIAAKLATKRQEQAAVAVTHTPVFTGEGSSRTTPPRKSDKPVQGFGELPF